MNKWASEKFDSIKTQNDIKYPILWMFFSKWMNELLLLLNKLKLVYQWLTAGGT